VAALADDDSVRALIADRTDHPDKSVISHLIHANRPADDLRTDHDVLPVLKHIAMSVIEPGWLAGWTLLALLDHPHQLPRCGRTAGCSAPRCTKDCAGADRSAR